MSTDTDATCHACLRQELADIVTVPDFEYAVGSGRYGRCRCCGSFTQVPMPESKVLSSYYPSRYHSFLPANFFSRLRQSFRIGRLKKSAADLTFKKSLLDFGCGQGLFLDTLAETFPEGRFFGYEISDHNEREVRYDNRVTIYRGDSDFFWQELPSIDIVTMNHVIEHLPEPLRALEKVHAKLAPGGVLDGQTPNADSIERRLFKNRWSGFHSPRHTVVFSAIGLETMLRTAGFKTVAVTSGFNPASWAVSLRSIFQDLDQPRGIPREGLMWTACVLVGAVPACIEGMTKYSGIVDFHAIKST
jgi:2-polyprenyl-3-methyl-5-hydroxy-6-metoxy-1,4-benzoquinol methylase